MSSLKRHVALGLASEPKWVHTKLGVNDDFSLATDSHSIQTKIEPQLLNGEQVEISIMYKDAPDESVVGENLSPVCNRPISITNLENSTDLSTIPAGDGAGSDFDILKFQEVSFQLFDTLSLATSQFDRLEIIDPFLHFKEQGASVEGDAGQYQQGALQHNLSFGSLTLPPDRNSVNAFGACSAGSSLVNGQSSFVPNNSTLNIQNSTLSAAQLALLNQATITIADLADGYLALTLGTTITLDTDAAGYGWFVDQTPFLNEEFVSGASSLVKREASEANDEIRATNNASPWQFFAKPDSAAAGKIDLMTVLSYEHGHK